jgi:hypothetical protein
MTRYLDTGWKKREGTYASGAGNTAANEAELRSQCPGSFLMGALGTTTAFTNLVMGYFSVEAELEVRGLVDYGLL